MWVFENPALQFSFLFTLDSGLNIVYFQYFFSESQNTKFVYQWPVSAVAGVLVFNEIEKSLNHLTEVT